MHGARVSKIRRLSRANDAAMHHVSYHQDGNNLKSEKYVGGLLQLSTWPVGRQGSCVDSAHESCFRAAIESRSVNGRDCMAASVETSEPSFVLQIRVSI